MWNRGRWQGKKGKKGSRDGPEYTVNTADIGGGSDSDDEPAAVAAARKKKAAAGGRRGGGGGFGDDDDDLSNVDLSKPLGRDEVRAAGSGNECGQWVRAMGSGERAWW